MYAAIGYFSGRQEYYRRRLSSGKTSSITMFSAAALPSAAFGRCNRSDLRAVSECVVHDHLGLN
jgi:hypothetical protein